MNLSFLARHLRERIGLDPDSLGANTLSRAITSRMKKHAISDLSQYSQFVLSDEAESQALVEDLMVPESWFFRGGKLFPYLGKIIAERGSSSSSLAPFQILSLPCSTGEEPYSLAITLDQLGVPSDRYSIDAVDISSRHIDQARQARYRTLSFRQTDEIVRSRYFRATGEYWELIPSIRERVQFHQGNLFDALFVLKERRFDLIFCRNLLIYLHAEARRRAVEILFDLLQPAGLLCVGHAEPIDPFDRRFVSIGPPEFFIYRREDSANRPPVEREIVLKSSGSSFPVEEPKPQRSVPSRGDAKRKSSPPLNRPTSVKVQVAPPANDSSTGSVIERARHAADGGDLVGALKMCEAELADGRPSSDLYSLLGIIRQAMQEIDQAEKAFARALYLDPAHQEALTHLMILTEGRGDRAGAERLRQRLSRATKRGGT